jgi:hypothetical protein
MNPRLIMLSLAVSCLLVCTSDAASTDPNTATVSISASGSLAMGTLGENAGIHPNRDYTFTKVPKPLQGLQFTSHQHKKPAGYTCTIKTSGRLYICLQKPLTPKAMKLTGAWKPTWQMDTVIKGRSYPWAIFSLDAKAGTAISIPASDRWGAIIAAGKIENLKIASPTVKAPRRKSARKSPAASDEYGYLTRDIANRRWFDSIGDQSLAKEALILPSDKTPIDVVLRRTEALATQIFSMKNAPDISKLIAELKALRSESPSRELFDKACKLRRKIAFANPLLNFDKLLFITRHDPGGPFHMCDQFYGCNAKPGGGLYVLSDAFSAKPKVTNLLANSVVQSGRLKGQKLTGGSFLSPELSYDGKTILFAWTQAKGKKTYTWGPEISYHIFKCNVDGSELQQLTDGEADDFDPCFLPDGRIAFISLRRGGYLRCGRHCPVYTLFAMNPNGSKITPLSHHETHEWQPSVDNDGMLVYTRWDYIDRDTNVAHHIWISYPDGRDPRSLHGNYPVDRNKRPWMEMEIRAIPGSHRYVAVTGAHHGNALGSLVLIDQRIEDDNAMSQLKRLTPEAPFPESETNTRTGMRYGTPWPLSEDFYLCVHDPAARNRGLHLIDRFGNRELIYRDASVSCLSPIPLRARTKPPVIPNQTNKSGPATIAVMNVYNADFEWPEDTKIKSLRIVQMLPKSTAPPNKPRIGVANQTNARAVLGDVPVEADGSCYFQAPVGVPIYFQALDSRGLAVQSMRSATYVHPGERLTCLGCHERKLATPKASNAPKMPLAMKRKPSKIRPEADGSNPFNYPRLVQPVLDKHCVKCHTQNNAKKDRKKTAPDLRNIITNKNGWTQSYVSLAGKYGFYFHVTNGSIRSGVHGGSRSIAGKFGAIASPLFKMLEKGHHDLKLPADDLHRLTLWLDSNSEFYGAYYKTKEQAAGEIVLPDLK